ncbi:cell growth-regulating nucleolar protein [Nilaparvata lugens]|uniref:cell growth-regulating nucleolar protein n=1 Tax=Nilaparvata lugens TaxID=108931 RepID=UPI00193DE405|nr:cell growth-regulating nucleolar protein [Nilaparvata lugens]
MKCFSSKTEQHPTLLELVLARATMVFFTCQHCGTSLKKNAVDKHYMTECRNRSPNLTCVDCLKDFFRLQTCGIRRTPSILAESRVIWMDVWYSASSEHSCSLFSRSVWDFLRYIVMYVLFLFQNFCKSNFGKFADIKQIDEVFDLFERVHKKSVDDSKVEKTGTNNSSATEANDSKSLTNGKSVDGIANVQIPETNEDEDGDVKMENETENLIKGKKLSKKERKEQKRKAKLAGKVNENASQDLENSDILENCENENIENETVSPKKTDSSMAVENGECNEEEGEKHLSKKEKKKLKKQERFQAELNEIELAKMAVDNDGEEISDQNKTHKKKKDKVNTNGVTENGHGSKKSKKRSREDSGMEIDEEQPVKKSKDSETHGYGDLDSSETNANGKKQFDWSDIIIQVLQSRKDKELSIKRLAKKVITEYQTNYATYETFDKISAKFHKKLKKIPGVKVLNDKAKLVTSDA